MRLELALLSDGASEGTLRAGSLESEAGVLQHNRAKWPSLLQLRH